MIQFDQEEKELSSLACIKVIGVGGAGGNTINRMIESGFQGAEFYAINTDAQALKTSLAAKKIQIGIKSTKGLGAGANPEAGKRAAEEDLDKVMQELSNADIVFVTGGMGGGTGSGAIPVIVQALKEKGILTIVVVTKPFAFEGKRRARITEQSLEAIKAVADTLLIIPNQKLLDVADETVSMINGFDMINEVLNQSVRGISEIITRPGHINVDFADVREIMKDKGLAVMGTARASGQGRAKKAALEAISSPLLETMSIAGARAVLLNITGGVDLGLHEISEAASVIYEQADENANIILGSVIDNGMGNEVLVTVIATGFIKDHPSHLDQIVSSKFEEQIPVATYKAQPQPVYVAVAQPTVPVAVQPVVAPVQAAPIAASLQEVAQPQQIQPQVAPLAAQQIVPQPVMCAVEQPKAVEIVSQPVRVAPVQEVATAPVETKEQPSVIHMAPLASPFEVRQEVVQQESSCVLRSLSEEEEFQKMLEEEAALQAQKVLKPAEKVQEQAAPTVAQQAESIAHIDVNDLDIPAFMRKQAKEKRTE